MWIEDEQAHRVFPGEHRNGAWTPGERPGTGPRAGLATQGIVEHDPETPEDQNGDPCREQRR